MVTHDTVVLSDLHLTEAHVADPRKPLWMEHQRRKWFIDDDVIKLIEHVEKNTAHPVELVFNGDTFDFDSVRNLPSEPEGSINWLARLRGLSSEEWMSVYKMQKIIDDHRPWFSSIADFVERGGRVIFVLGNHDVELHWPSVQKLICDVIDTGNVSGARSVLDTKDNEKVVFCPWFFIAGGDTFISHGHQYDPNCVTENPIHPIISIAGKPRVRVSFGDLAGRYMLNGMGYFNPHATENYIRSGWSYLTFFVKHMMRRQPLMVWTWFWSAMVTMHISIRDHWRFAMRDPLMLEERVHAIAKQSQATPRMVRQLNALSVPSACRNPLRIMRELWLDRAAMFIALMAAAWQIILHINVAWDISPLWVFLPIAILMPPYFIYAQSVRHTVFTKPLLSIERAELINKITKVERVVFGHTHLPAQERVGPVHYLNGGFWSPAFAEPDCETRIGTQTFVWIRQTGSGPRQADLYEWAPGGATPSLFQAETSEARADVATGNATEGSQRTA